MSVKRAILLPLNRLKFSKQVFSSKPSSGVRNWFLGSDAPRTFKSTKRHNYEVQIQSFSSGEMFSMEHLENASISDVDKIAEVGRKFLDGEMQSDDKTHDIRKWLTAAANFGHIESAFLLGVFLVEHKLTDVDADSVVYDDEEMSPENRAANVKKEIKNATQIARTEKKIRMQKQKGIQTGNLDEEQKVSDYELGLDWLRKASRKNHGKAMCYLGNLLLAKDGPGDASEAVLWYEKASKLAEPSADALFNLGTLYFEGKEGTLEKDLIKSFDCFKKAADLGDLSSQFWVGYCYFTGEGFESDAEVSVKPQLAEGYLKMCAEKGHSAALYYLATLYRSGLRSIINPAENIPADHERFLKYLILAVEAEDPDALFCMGDLYLNSEHNSEFSNYFPKNEKKGRELYEQASELGHVEVRATYLPLYLRVNSLLGKF
jgi:TPR repeat protein